VLYGADCHVGGEAARPPGNQVAQRRACQAHQSAHDAGYGRPRQGRAREPGALPEPGAGAVGIGERRRADQLEVSDAVGGQAGQRHGDRASVGVADQPDPIRLMVIKQVQHRPRLRVEVEHRADAQGRSMAEQVGSQAGVAGRGELCRDLRPQGAGRSQAVDEDETAPASVEAPSAGAVCWWARTVRSGTRCGRTTALPPIPIPGAMPCAASRARAFSHRLSRPA